ncbi:MAG: AAA family ATPase [Actinomycetota bacterium]|nr:AAA family ATPase [Actinomycetota bacterium]MDD5667516.1 AAA family ATPase [Actinomycetota bacterium]
MKITAITLRRFRRFRQVNISLDEGINVVKGPNESGKSTLVQALLAAFFWKVDATRKEVRDSLTWGEQGGFVIEMEGEASGLPFQLVKDFSTKRASLVWGDREMGDQAAIDESVREWLGLGSELAFRSTAGIRQDEVAAISAGRKELSQSIQGTITGSDTSAGATEALDAIDRELTELLRGARGTAKNPGPLVCAEEEMSAWRARRDELAAVVENRVEARRRLEQCGMEMEGISSRLEALRRLADDSSEHADIEEDIEDFHRRYRQLESAVSLAAEDAALQKDERERYGALKGVLEDRRDELGKIEMRRAGILEGLGIMRGRLEEARKARYRAWAPYLLLAGITLILVGLAGIALSPYMLAFTLAGSVCVALSLFPGGYLVFLRRGREYTALEEQVRELEGREREINAQAEGILSEAGCDSVESFTRMKLGYLELLARRKEIADKLEVLVPDGVTARVEEEARQLATEVSLRERRLKELRGRTVDAVGLQEVMRDKEALVARLDGLKEERVRLEVAVSEEGVEEEYLRACEEVEYLSERIDRLRRRARALEMAREWLEKAASTTLASAARVMEEMIGGYIARITDNRYNRVSVDEGTLRIRVWSREKGDEVEPEVLSRGTVDQLYLAARLSLVEVICGDRRPPLLLDDPFVTFDPRRLERSLELLGDFARGRQVIVFTCGDQYDAYADNLVRL